MKQHGQAQNPVLLDFLHGMNGMFPHTVTMMFRNLRGFHHPVKLREKYSGKSQLIYRTHLLRMCRGEQFHHFGLDSLRTDFL